MVYSKIEQINSEYIKRTYALALKGLGRTSPNPMVGALIVKNNKVLAEGWHRRCGALHAEIEALRKAGKQAHGAKLYVTLEPCFHVGRTPPCVDEIINSQIKEVIIGMKDPNPLTHGKSIIKLKRAGIKVKVGFLKKELLYLNESFVKYIQFHMPFVVAKIAQTLDGKIASETGHSQWITSRQTRKYSHNLRNNFDAILVGINTILQDNPCLNASRKSKRLKKIVLDSSLRISPKALIFKDTFPHDCILATTKRANLQRYRYFNKKGVSIITCPQKEGRVHLKWLLQELAKREITNILFEGGAQVIGSALKEQLVDKMHIYMAPKIMGAQNALSSITGLKVMNMEQALKLNVRTFRKINQDYFMEAYII